MRVFVTGVDVYVGVVLAPYLLARGMEVSANRRLAATPHAHHEDPRSRPRAVTRLKQLEFMLAAHQIDDEFYWC
jgi:hypothetical protein